MIPNKEKLTKDRRGRLRKTDNLLFHMRHEVKGEKKERMPEDEKAPEAQAEEAKLKPVVAPVKKQAAKTMDAAATAELLLQLRQKLKLPGDRALTWSYLEYSCVYHGIALNDLQKKALRHALAAPQEPKAAQ